MKNITVTVDDETYRRARVQAAQQDTSVSALVKRFLKELAVDESDAERLKRKSGHGENALAHFALPTVCPVRMCMGETHERAAFHRHQHSPLLDQP